MNTNAAYAMACELLKSRGLGGWHFQFTRLRGKTAFASKGTRTVFLSRDFAKQSSSDEVAAALSTVVAPLAAVR